MILTLKKIQHKGAHRIGICFPYSFEVNNKMKSLGAFYSSTLRCWYLNYNNTNYHLLQKNFDNLVIENPKPENAKTALVAGPESRDLPPIVTSALVDEKSGNEVTKFPEKAVEKVLQEHKAEIPLAKKLRLQMHENMIYTHVTNKAINRIQSPLDRLNLTTEDKNDKKNDKKV